MSAALRRTPRALFSWICSCLSTNFPKLVSCSDTALNDMKTSEAKGQGNMTESNKNKVPVMVCRHCNIYYTPDLDGTDNIIFEDFCYV